MLSAPQIWCAKKWRRSARAARVPRRRCEGKRAAIYVGGAFKAFSLVRSLRTLGMQTVLVGSQTGNKETTSCCARLCDEGTIIVDDSNPLELASFIEEKQVDLFIGGVKERPIAYKLGVGFCDHNHERKIALAGFEGMLNFASEVYSSCMSPVWQFYAAQAPSTGSRRKEMLHEHSVSPSAGSKLAAELRRHAQCLQAVRAAWGDAWHSAAWRARCRSCMVRRVAPPTSAAT